MSLGFVQKNTPLPRQSTKHKVEDIQVSLESPLKKQERTIDIVPMQSTRRLTNSKFSFKRKMTSYSMDLCTDESYLHQTTYNIIEFILLWGIIETVYVTYNLYPSSGISSSIPFGMKTVAPLTFAYVSGKILCNHGSRGGLVGITFLWGAMYHMVIEDLLTRATEEKLDGLEMNVLLQNDLEYAMFVAIYICPIIVVVSHLLINFYRKLLDCIFMCPQIRVVEHIFEILVFLGLLLSVFLIASETMTEIMKWIVESAIPSLYNTFADLSIPLINVVSDVTKILFLGETFKKFSEERAAQDFASGKSQSLWFLILCNPGPGIGLLLVYWMTGARAQKNTCIEKLRHCALIAIPIVLFGGVYEVYYFFAITKPRLILALIAGGIVGSLTFVVTQVGLYSNPTSYSVIEIINSAPPNTEIGIILGFSFSAIATWVIGWILIKTRVSKFFDNIRNCSNEIFRSLDRCAFNC